MPGGKKIVRIGAGKVAQSTSVSVSVDVIVLTCDSRTSASLVGSGIGSILSGSPKFVCGC
jgi:hypothetical protein